MHTAGLNIAQTKIKLISQQLNVSHHDVTLQSSLYYVQRLNLSHQHQVSMYFLVGTNTQTIRTWVTQWSNLLHQNQVFMYVVGTNMQTMRTWVIQGSNLLHEHEVFMYVVGANIKTMKTLVMQWIKSVTPRLSLYECCWCKYTNNENNEVLLNKRYNCR